MTVDCRCFRRGREREVRAWSARFTETLVLYDFRQKDRFEVSIFGPLESFVLHVDSSRWIGQQGWTVSLRHTQVR